MHDCAVPFSSFQGVLTRTPVLYPALRIATHADRCSLMMFAGMTALASSIRKRQIAARPDGAAPVSFDLTQRW